MVEKVREISAECGRPVGILLDCNGPKLRTELLLNGQTLHLNKGDTFVFYENEPPPQESNTNNYVSNSETSDF
jgi:pyruvate kinase